MKGKAALFWSGGKDSAFALYQVQRNYPELEVICLITTLNEEYRRISMHGIREELLDKQANATGIPLFKMWVPNEPTNKAYEEELHRALTNLKSSGTEYIIFGDIFLEDLKQYRDNILKGHGLTGVYPLWKKDTSQLIRDFVESGFRAVTCCISTSYLDKTWLGREINQDILRELPSGVDPCGENGEFHTFCFDGPVFNIPIAFTKGEERFVPMNIKADKEVGFWYIDFFFR